MIASLRGTIVVRQPGRVVLEVSGVGYEISVPVGDFDRIPSPGQELFLHIDESIGMYGGGTRLYGFLGLDEQMIFGKLRDVPGIGAKKSMEYLDKVNHDLPRFRSAIQSKDHAALQTLFGFTKKTAEKLIVSLKDSLGTLPAGLRGAPVPPVNQMSLDALQALIQLGFREAEAREALERASIAVPTAGGAEHLIKEALKELRTA